MRAHPIRTHLAYVSWGDVISSATGAVMLGICVAALATTSELDPMNFLVAGGGSVIAALQFSDAVCELLWPAAKRHLKRVEAMAAMRARVIHPHGACNDTIAALESTVDKLDNDNAELAAEVERLTDRLTEMESAA